MEELLGLRKQVQKYLKLWKKDCKAGGYQMLKRLTKFFKQNLFVARIVFRI